MGAARDVLAGAASPFRAIKPGSSRDALRLLMMFTFSNFTKTLTYVSPQIRNFACRVGSWTDLLRGAAVDHAGREIDPLVEYDGCYGPVLG